ncbi:hypothetical protein N7499_005220 [Penicillium canescens]|nr:hypothetical protein N7499_005220 [Penicillium canescens]KAJ6162365.1 hypothetical protein N7485_010595 [Penicillium canescens]
MFVNRKKAFMSRMFDNSVAINLPGPSSRRKHACEMPRKMMVAYGCTWISVGNLTKLAKRYRQMHTSFAQPDAANDLNPQELRDVYVVARPDRWSHAFTDPGSPCYWSLYCDGHYYHIEKGDKSVRIALGDDDYSEQSQKKFIPGGPQIPPFIAYHFGKTDYSPQQIHGIAVWVIDQMVRDDLSETNYGHFVSGLAVRIICAPRNSTVLMGNMMQIWAQDQFLRAAGPDSVVPNGFYTGSRLVGPTEKIDTFCARKSLRHKVEIDARQLAVCWFNGLQGFIPSDIPETHRFIRGWKVATQSNITKTVESTLELEKRTLRRSSNINEQPRMAVIIGLRDSSCNDNPQFTLEWLFLTGFCLGAKIPKDLETVHCFSSLYYIRSKRSVTEEGNM